jgi:DHA1 family multidrug resistance protein-like MFS transporter
LGKKDPDVLTGRRKWENWQKTLAAMWTAQFIAMTSIAFIGSFLVLYLEQELGVRNQQELAYWTALLAFITPLVAAFLQPFWGSLGDKYGRKLMIVRALSGNFVVIFMMAFVNTPLALFGLRVLQGCFGGVNPPSTALTTSQTPTEKIGFALGLIRTAIIAGSAFGPLLGGVVADQLGYRWVFIVMGLLSFISAVFVSFTVKEEYHPVPQTYSKGNWRNIRETLRSHWLVVMLFVTFLVSFGTMNIQPFFPKMVEKIVGEGRAIATLSGNILFFSGLASAIVSVAIAGVGRRIGYKKVLLITAGGAGFFFFLHTWAVSYEQLFFYRVMAGAFMGGMLLTRDVMISFYIPSEKRGTAYGIVGSSMMLGNVFGPAIGGLLAATYSVNAVFIMTGVIFSIAILWIATTLKEIYGAPEIKGAVVGAID